MKVVLRTQVSQKRAKRILKMYNKIKAQQPLATKNAIVNHIAQIENVSSQTVLRAVNYECSTT